MRKLSDIDLHDAWFDTEATATAQAVDWPDMFRLAVVVSVFAAIAAVALMGHVSEMTIVIGVIVVATLASWFHMEHDGSARRPAHVRHH
jgi:xanthine/uracil permease